MNKTIIYLIAVIVITFSFMQCSNENPTQAIYKNGDFGQISDKVASVQLLLVPSKVPEIVDSLAVIQALKIGCDGIRILEAESEKDENSFFVSFFTDTEGIKKEAIYSLDGENVILNEDESLYLNNILDTYYLKKTNNDCDHIWRLAYIFENANYDSLNGLYYQFTQRAHNVGFYHKVCERLGTASGDFPGGMNNLISSHLWANEVRCGKKTVVDKFKVWDGTYRSDSSYEFTSTKAHHDNNYADESFWLNIPIPPWTVPYPLNDAVSSIDMTYWVYNN